MRHWLLAGITLSLLMAPTGASAGQPYRHQHRASPSHHHHGSNDVAAALLGGIVGGIILSEILTPPRPVYVRPAPPQDPYNHGYEDGYRRGYEAGASSGAARYD